MRPKKIITIIFIIILSINLGYSQDCSKKDLIKELYDAIISVDKLVVNDILNEDNSIVNCKYENLPLFYYGVNTDDIDIVNILLNHGVDISIGSNFYEVFKNIEDLPTLDRVIKAGLKKDMLNKKQEGAFSGGATAFIIACRLKNENAIFLLLQNNCDVNIKDNFGKTGLIEMMKYTLFQDEEETVLRILNKFIDKVDNISLKDDEGKSALDYAKEAELHKVVRMLELEALKQEHKDDPAFQEKLDRRTRKRN